MESVRAEPRRSNDPTVRNEPSRVRLVDRKDESFGRFSRPLDLGAIMPDLMKREMVTRVQHPKAPQDQGVRTADEVAPATERRLTRE